MFGQAGPEQAYECGKKAKQSVKLWTPTFVLLIFLGTLTSIGFNMVSPIDKIRRRAWCITGVGWFSQRNVFHYGAHCSSAERRDSRSSE